MKDETGRLGDVPRLAPGAVNLMWEIEKGLDEVCEAVGPFLEATKPRKTNFVAVSGDNYEVKLKEVDSD